MRGIASPPARPPDPPGVPASPAAAPVPPVAALRGGIVLLGAWTLFAQACILAGRDFGFLLRWTPLPLLLGLLLWAWIGRGERDGGERDGTGGRPILRLGRDPLAGRPGAAALLLAGLFALALLGRKAPWLSFGAAVVWIGIWWSRGDGETAASNADSPPHPRGESWTVLLLAAGMALLMAGAKVPDGDDSCFVSLAVATLDFPSLPLFSFDGMHRTGLPPVEQVHHLLQVYELMVAVLARATGIPVLDWYYLLLPPFWAAAGTVAHWHLFRRHLSARGAVLGILVLGVILASWGDGHWTWGRFALLRIFQGKGILLFALLPALLGEALRHRDGPSLRGWVSLLLHLAAAAGVSINGFLVAPAAVLLLLAAPPLDRRGWSALLGGVAACLALLPFALGMWQRFAPHRPRGGLTAVTSRWGYWLVTGEHRTVLVLAGLLLLPAALRWAGARRGAILGWWGMGLALLLFPLTVPWAGSVVRALGWRIYWAVPVPFLLALTAALLLEGRSRHPRLGPLLAAGWLLAFVAAGRPALPARRWAWGNLGRHAVAEKAFALARQVAAAAPREGVALVPEQVALHLTRLHGAPPLLAIRPIYLRKLERHLSREDYLERKLLHHYVSGRASRLSPRRAAELMATRGVTTLLVPRNRPEVHLLRRELIARGFRIVPTRGHLLATAGGGGPSPLCHDALLTAGPAGWNNRIVAREFCQPGR